MYYISRAFYGRLQKRALGHVSGESKELFQYCLFLSLFYRNRNTVSLNLWICRTSS